MKASNSRHDINKLIKFQNYMSGIFVISTDKGLKNEDMIYSYRINVLINLIIKKLKHLTVHAKRQFSRKHLYHDLIHLDSSFIKFSS